MRDYLPDINIFTRECMHIPNKFDVQGMTGFYGDRGKLTKVGKI